MQIVPVHDSVATAIQVVDHILQRRGDWRLCFRYLPLSLLKIEPVAKPAGMRGKDEVSISYASNAYECRPNIDR